MFHANFQTEQQRTVDHRIAFHLTCYFNSSLCQYARYTFIVVVKIMFRYSGFTRLRRVGLSAKFLFIRCLMPDSGYQIPDHGIAPGRRSQPTPLKLRRLRRPGRLLWRSLLALSFYESVKILVCNLNSKSIVFLKRNEILKIAIDL